MNTRLFSLYVTGILLLVSCSSTYKFSRSDIREESLRSHGYIERQLMSIKDDSRFWCFINIENKPVRMLIDSGANSTDLQKNIANFVGVTKEPKYKVVSKGVLGRTVKSTLNETSLQCGPQVINPFLLAVTSETLKTKNSQTSYNGQIGLDALVEIGALIEISSSRIWIPRYDIQPHDYNPSLKTDSRLGFETLPLYSKSKYSHLLLSSTYNGRRLNWVIDTGAEVSILDKDIARQINLETTHTNNQMIDIAGDSSRLDFAIANNIMFGQTRFTQFPLAIGELQVLKKSFSMPDGSPVHGILGVDFLKATNALLDPRSKVIHIGRAEDREQNQSGTYIVAVNKFKK